MRALKTKYNRAHEVVYLQTKNALKHYKPLQEKRLEVLRGKRRLGLRIVVVVPVGVGVEVLPSFRVSIGDSSIAINMGYGVGGLSTEVLLALCCTIARRPGLDSTLLGHLHLGLVALVVLAADGRQEVDEEAKDIPGVDERDNPFEYSGYVPVIIQLSNTEHDAEADSWQMLAYQSLETTAIKALTRR
jgi:hypothetical protein